MVSEAQPWRTIGYALTQITTCAEEGRPFTIQLSEGVYEETLSLRQNVTIAGSNPENPSLTRIYPKADSGRGGLATGNSVIEAADGIAGNNVIRDITIEIESGAPNGVSLLKILNVGVQVDNVIFNGRNRPGSIGVDISSPGSSASMFTDCVFSRVGSGVFAVDTEANITRCTFDDIQGTAVFVRPPEETGAGASRNPLLGDQARMQSTGLNTFKMPSINGGDGLVIDTGITSLDDNTAILLAQRNNWEGATSEEEIVARVSANVNVGARIGGAGILGSTLVVEVLDLTSRNAIENATVTASASAGSGQTVSEGFSGIYVFPVLTAARYTITAEADGYESESASINAKNAIESVRIDLAAAITTPTRTLQQIAESLQGGFGNVDINNDNQLSFAEAMASESTITQGQFSTIDTNNDGFITPEELERYLTPEMVGCKLKKNNLGAKFGEMMGDIFLVGLTLLSLVVIRR